MKILVTGAAGFIGSKLMFMLAKRGDEVVGLDNINDYYDVRLKYGRLAECGFEKTEDGFVFGTIYQSSIFPNCKFVRMGLEEKAFLDRLFEKEKFDKVVNLAAQAGVRYSITNPYAYMWSNLYGFLNILIRFIFSDKKAKFIRTQPRYKIECSCLSGISYSLPSSCNFGKHQVSAVKSHRIVDILKSVQVDGDIDKWNLFIYQSIQKFSAGKPVGKSGEDIRNSLITHFFLNGVNFFVAEINNQNGNDRKNVTE